MYSVELSPAAARDYKKLPVNEIEDVNIAIEDFNKQLEADKKVESVVDITLSPQDKNALSFLAAFLNMEEVSIEQKELVKATQEAIRVHKFNQLPKKVNRLAKAVKKTPMRIDLMINKLFFILEEFPLQREENKEERFKEILPLVKGELPDIIISESFMK